MKRLFTLLLTIIFVLPLYAQEFDGKRCVNRDKNPFAPMANGYDCHLFGDDAFSRPYCRTCGSHNIYVRGGTRRPPPAIANAAEFYYFCIMDYPQINLQEWTKVGEGYNGEALVSPLHPGLLLKLVRSDMGSAEKVEQEFEASRIAFEAGIPTPRVYEIVRDGKDHGILSEKIEGKHSFARLCANTPAQIPQLAAQMADYGKQLHRMPILSSARVIPMKELLLTALSTSILVTDTQRAQLTALVKAMPDTGTVLHGDFQPGNIILADEKHYWIDLGWLSQGWYMMDLAHLYKMMVEDSVIPAVQELTHMTREQMLTFWDAFAKAYTGTEDVEALNRTLRPYAALDIIRTFYLHQNDNPQLLAFLRMRIGEELK